MGWVYILVRVFPFWAIPLGFTLIAVAWRSKRAPKARRSGLYALGIAMLVGSVLFLAMQGHVSAVPWLHEVFNTPLLRRG